MLRLLSIFNILLGLIAVLFSLVLGSLSIGLAPGPSLAVFLEVGAVMAPIGIAGLLYAWSGVLLWRSRPGSIRSSVLWMGCAWMLVLLYCITWLGILRGRLGVGGTTRQPGDAFDEELVVFVFVPMALLGVIAVQIGYLWSKMSGEPRQFDKPRRA